MIKCMRIVTEDAELVLWSVAGAQLLAAEKEDLAELIEHCTVFAKVTPQQKMSIVTGLQSKGHIVGFQETATMTLQPCARLTLASLLTL